MYIGRISHLGLIYIYCIHIYTQVLAVSPRHSQAELALIPEMGQALRSSRPSEAEIEARLEAALAKRRATLAAEREKAPLPVAVESERAYTYTPPNPAKKEATLTDFQMVRHNIKPRLVGHEENIYIGRW